MPSPVTRARALSSAVLASTAAAALILAGCGSTSNADAGSSPQVVASFYPLAWVTERVAGDGTEVTNLTQPGGEPHDLELGIAQTAALEDADLVVVEHGFQPAVDDAVEGLDDSAVLDVEDVVELRPATEHEGEDHHEEDAHADEEAHAGEEDTHADAHADEEAHAGEEDTHADEHADEEAHADEEEDAHDHGDLDPHFWHDPLLMADLADAVAAKLGELDPERAADFEANAAELRTELEQLDTSYAEGLASCERDLVVVSHDAFGYLAKYGLHLEPIAGLSPDAEPTPAVIAELQDLIREEGITTVFSERLASPAMAEALAADTGVRTDVLDPIEGLSDETADQDYLGLMQANLEALRRANGC
ncbi:zinc ABC transporter substrate-binding protein [Nocardioides gansuensis]|uniref:Zinc ABC transporter substrate-binding protein n=1 Tax=Nocardioides gansuensis TaxID=2138300 RepID=A0A2T8FCM9_9ACTN|nr:metal ABC transporter substrate-binding protein [Nocardioides gansuensis]PVG83468.1 zinc ABC transporter substrate-binding protein [Nocardioides gansuensis]